MTYGQFTVIGLGLSEAGRIPSHDNNWPCTLKFYYCYIYEPTRRGVWLTDDTSGATTIHNADQLTCCLDHDIQSKTPANLKTYALIEELAKIHGVRFQGVGEATGYWMMVQECICTRDLWIVGLP